MAGVRNYREVTAKAGAARIRLLLGLLGAPRLSTGAFRRNFGQCLRVGQRGQRVICILHCRGQINGRWRSPVNLNKAHHQEDCNAVNCDRAKQRFGGHSEPAVAHAPEEINRSQHRNPWDTRRE